MGKRFVVGGKKAKKIISTFGYWYYYDRGYHEIDLYIYLDGNKRWLNSQYSSIIEQVKEQDEYEFEIEHHDYDTITAAYKSLME